MSSRRIEDSPPAGVVDVRSLPCILRHAAITDRFDGLRPGESFVIVTDHEPAALRTRFDDRAEWPCAWVDHVGGPDAWRVRVSRP